VTGATVRLATGQRVRVDDEWRGDGAVMSEPGRAPAGGEPTGYERRRINPAEDGSQPG